MFYKIFGKKNSIQRDLVIRFIISLILVIGISIAIFYLGINNSINDKLIDIHISSREQIEELLDIVRRSMFITIASVIVISVIMIQFATKKMLQPLRQLNEATKKVASGDFSVKLETKRQDEVAELTDNFNEMVKELNSIECLQEEFVNNVSHEIKTPISSIQGFAKLLQDEKLTNEERNEYAGIIIEESNRLLNLSSNILKLSKLQNQERITNKEEFSIAEQIRKSVSVLEPKWKEKDITFNVALQEKNFYGDKNLIYQVWMNLIDNAIKFSNQGGAIDIKIKNTDDKIEVMIKDYGIGMDENELKKIFDKFYQIDKSHSGEGSGLGLAITKRIVELSGGKIEVKSEKNKGTTFKIYLPIEKSVDSKIIIK